MGQPMTKKEIEAAKAWRLALNLSPFQLGELIGYSGEAIYLLERGITSRAEPVPAWTWLRYKRACAGLDAERKGHTFKW